MDAPAGTGIAASTVAATAAAPFRRVLTLMQTQHANPRLEKLKPDFNLDLRLHEHVTSLFEDIRSKAIIQHAVDTRTVTWHGATWSLWVISASWNVATGTRARS